MRGDGVNVNVAPGQRWVRRLPTFRFLYARFDSFGNASGKVMGLEGVLIVAVRRDHYGNNLTLLLTDAGRVGWLEFDRLGWKLVAC